MTLATVGARTLRWARVDIRHRHPGPSAVGLALATVLSIGVSLGADALLVWAGTGVFPSTKGYVHFRFSDYGLLTTIGVLIACAAWPIVARISWAPRWLFLRLAVGVTLILWIPDLYLLIRHQPVRAVVVLMAMHLAIAVVTYNLLVRVAPVAEATGSTVTAEADRPAQRSSARLATPLVLLVIADAAVGIAVVVSVPTGRPSGWLPMMGRGVYLVHAVLGFVIAAGAVMYLVRSRGSGRIVRLSGWIGGTGVAVAGAGGLLAVAHPLRLVGFGFMLLGSITAAFGYLLPALDRMTDQGNPAAQPTSDGGAQ